LDWYENLEDRPKSFAVERMKSADAVWFFEDMEKGQMDRPALYSKLLELVESNTAPISIQTYEAYCSFIVGWASVVVLESDQKMEMPQLKLSETAAVLKDSDLVQSHDPARLLEKLDTAGGSQQLKRLKSATTGEAKVFTVRTNRLIILTPEQKAA